MSIESFISYRYLKTKKSGFIAFLNFVGIAGIAVGVLALIVVISVMEGFGTNLREKIIGATPHILVEKEIGLSHYQDTIQKIQSVPMVTGVSPYIQGNIFLEYSGQAKALALRGIAPLTEPSVTKIKDYIVKGDLNALQGDSIVIGYDLARYYGYQLGDTVVLISPGSGMQGKGWRYHLKIVGIFNTGMADFDNSLALVNMEKAQEIFNMSQGMSTGIGVKVHDPYKANHVKDLIYQKIGYSFLMRSWIDNNDSLFKALKLEKLGLYIILSLMILIASFNVISTLIVTVMSKVQDIGVLKSIGATRKSIRNIFIKQGVYMGLKGIAWGLFSGFGVCYILKTYIRVPREIYAVDHVPVDIQTVDVLIITGIALIISYLSTLYPASKAAALQPVEALRYE